MVYRLLASTILDMRVYRLRSSTALYHCFLYTSSIISLFSPPRNRFTAQITEYSALLRARFFRIFAKNKETQPTVPIDTIAPTVLRSRKVFEDKNWVLTARLFSSHSTEVQILPAALPTLLQLLQN